MKYKCGDGVNRDKHIEKYLHLEKKAVMLGVKINLATRLMDSYRYEMQRISHDQLGLFGHYAMVKVEDRK